jgi:hypothetical protein
VLIPAYVLEYYGGSSDGVERWSRCRSIKGVAIMTGSREIPFGAWEAAYESFNDCLRMCSERSAARLQDCLSVDPGLQHALNCAAASAADGWACILGCSFRFVAEVNQLGSEWANQVVTGWADALMAGIDLMLDNAGFCAAYFEIVSYVAGGLGGILVAAAQLPGALGLSAATVSWFAVVGLALLINALMFHLVSRYFSSLASQVESRSDFNQSEPSGWARLNRVPDRLLGQPQYDLMRVGVSAFQLTRTMPSLIRSLGRIDGLAAASELPLAEIIEDGSQQVLDIQRASLATASDLGMIEQLTPEMNQACDDIRQVLRDALEAAETEIPVADIRAAARQAITNDVVPVLELMELDEDEIASITEAVDQLLDGISEASLATTVLIDDDLREAMRGLHGRLSALATTASGLRIPTLA